MELNSENIASNSENKKFEFLKFHGDTADYFKIWLPNLLLTLLTFGIYSAWAKVRSKKYFYGVTEYQGARFDYHAEPIPILIGRIIAAIIFILYSYGGLLHPFLGILGVVAVFFAMPFMYVNSLKFNLKNSSYRNIRFSFRASVSEAFGHWLRLTWFPLALTMLMGLVILIFGALPTDKEELAAMTEIYLHPTYIATMLVALINLIYFAYIAPRFYDRLLTFTYNNIYYGGSRLSFKSDRKIIFREIFKPIYIKTVLVFIALTVSMAILPALIASFGGFFFTLVYALVVYYAVIYISLLFPYKIINYVWSRVECGTNSSCITLKWGDYFKINAVNFLVIGLSLGLFYPWAKIRTLRLLAETRGFAIDDIDNFTAESEQKISALAEEATDIFDFGIEIGL